MEDQQPCPCGGRLYTECCLPLHLGQQKAKDAEQLMRSRYSAFVKQQINYIIDTTALEQQKYLVYGDLLSWSQETDWKSLDVIAYDYPIDKNHASVEFKAYYWVEGQTKAHHEKSFFVSHQSTWYFLDPTVEIAYTMKQVCICGSHKKFKHCCAKYL